MTHTVTDKNFISGAPQMVLHSVWDGHKKIAGIAQSTAQLAWSYIPDVKGMKTAVETAWENSPHKTTIKAVAAAGTGVLAATGAVALAAPLALAATAGGVTAAATLMATHPDHSIMVNIPLQRPIELRTPGIDPGDPIDPTKSLAEIGAKANAFTEKHPIGMAAERLVQKPIDSPQKARAFKEQQARTDLQKDKLVENISAYATASFIFVNRLGLNIDQDILIEMTQAATKRASEGEKANLWDACIETLGKRGIELSMLQWIRAKFWYFLSDSIGIIPNTLKELGARILAHARGGVKDEQSKVSIDKILKLISSFLEKYNGAVQNYVNAGQPGFPPIEGDLSDYRKKIIDQVGDDSCLARTIDQLKPGENLGEKMMEELCKEFVATIVDDPALFPSIPFFKDLQKISIFGIRIGIFFDLMEWVIGGAINWIGKKLIKAYIPDHIQEIVKNGIDQALPGKYSFKIGVANALKAQVETLSKEFEKGIPSTPLPFEKNELLNETIGKLIKTLELNACEGDQDKLRIKLEELKRTSVEAEKMQDHLRIATIKGAQLLIHHYTQKPEAIEELFETLFKLSNDTFQPEAPLKTEEDSRIAIEGLNNSMYTLIEAQVKEGVNEKVLGAKPDVLQTILLGKRIELLDNEGRPNPAAQVRDAHGNLPYQLDEEGKPVYKGLFYEQQEKATATAQVLKGLSLKLLKETHADAEATVLNPPRDGNPPIIESLEIRQAKAKLAAKQVAVNHAKTRFQREERNPDLDEFQRIDARNALNIARIEYKIADEKLKVIQQIARLQHLIATKEETLNNLQGNDLQQAQRDLLALRIQRDFAEEELRLVRSMEECNRLEHANNHPLKKLDNYMKVIDEFAKYAKSLNIDLYDEMVQKIFYRTFGPIYQEAASLAEQALVLQSLEKSYDKSKRLAKHFADIELGIPLHGNDLLGFFRGKLRELKQIDDSFNEYEAQPQENVVPFDALIKEFHTISKEEKRLQELLQQIGELGTPDQLSSRILKHPKKWVEILRKKIPLEEQQLLFDAIAILQENATLSPMPDLIANHAEVEAKLKAVIQKYKNLRQDQIQLKTEKLQEIAEWVRRRNAALEEKRNRTRDQLMRGFEKLKQDTDALATKIETVQPPPVHFPVHAAVPLIPGAAGAIGQFADPMVAKATTLVKSAYTFITSREISEASSRLALGEIIRIHKKPKEKGFFSRIWG